MINQDKIDELNKEIAEEQYAASKDGLIEAFERERPGCFDNE